MLERSPWEDTGLYQFPRANLVRESFHSHCVSPNLAMLKLQARRLLSDARLHVFILLTFTRMSI